MSPRKKDKPGSPVSLVCEGLQEPLGLTELKPRLSWRLSDPRRGAKQNAYRLLVASSPQLLAHGKGDLWDSGVVRSDSTRYIEYAGAALKSRQRCYWKVMSWDGKRVPSPWSKAASWEMGLVYRSDWHATWIGLAHKKRPYPVPQLRKGFSIKRRLRRARLYTSALGVYELRLNGARVGDHVLAPGWTDYKTRALVQAHDVTALLRHGRNTLGALVGVGWYCGPLGGGLKRDWFGEHPPRLLAQLELEYTNGQVERVVSDASWRGAFGPINCSEIYAGEHYDARRETRGWDTPAFKDKRWRSVDTFPFPDISLDGEAQPPMRVTQQLTPVSVKKIGRAHIFDLGQNMVGFCRLTAKGKAGTKVVLRHAEELNADGTIYTENLRRAAATDSYILKGGARETYTPSFTYHGFRYVEVKGYPGRATPDSLRGLVFHSDCAATSALSTSSPLVNKLFANINWSQRGNMHSVITDCPQRDERLGWMGDAQLFARTSCYNMEMSAFYTKFARDIVDAQHPQGSYADVSPRLSGWVLPPDGAPGWMDAGLILPWTAYLMYGDRRILERNFASMCRYIKHVSSNNPDGLWRKRRGNDYGDWVPAGEHSDKEILATLIYFYSVSLMVKIAAALGKAAERKRFAALALTIRRAFNKRYVRKGRIRKATQTLDALALNWGILSPADRRTVFAHLVTNLARRDHHLSCGCIGTQQILPCLCANGRSDLAYRLLLNRDYPSWGYMIAKGATTIWERWNSDTEGPGMNSRNHFFLGTCGEWLFSHMAGIEVDEEAPGFKHLIIKPHLPTPGGEISEVAAAYQSPHGTIAVAWSRRAHAVALALMVPPNATATVHLPARSAAQVSESGKALARAPGISKVRRQGDNLLCEASAGSYTFISQVN